MDRMRIWLKERSFLVLLFLGGMVYLTVSGNWKMYGEPLNGVSAWCGVELEELGIGKKDDPIKKEEGNRIRVRTADMERADDFALWDAFGEGFWVSAEDMPGWTGDMAEGNAPGYMAEGNAPGDILATNVPETAIPDGGAVETPPVSEPPIPTEEPAYRNPEEIVYANVEDSYFSDAVFIGDSRTVGMQAYGGLADISTFYAATGLSVHKMFDKEIVEVPGQKDKITVEEALQTNNFEKIYLMIGINEMGTGTVESFMEKYKEAVEHLRELQPDAIIYLQAIMKVTEERSNKGDYIHNEGIDLRNAEIAKLADNVHIYYLDVNESISDETGAMDASYTHDGVHLKAQYVSLWKDYLKAHAVSLE